jgi:fluoride ion exporter CrcB/FEX
MKRNVFMIAGLLAATIFGIYGQSISYFLNEHFPKIKPVAFLTVFTIASMALYIVIPVLAYLKQFPQRLFYFIASGMIGIPTSFWSFFVLAMWMG